MIDVDFGDVIDYFGEDPETRSIVMYIESITDAREFMSAARGFARTKPIIVVKSGRFSESAKAAASHTGALAGEDAIYDSAFRRAGVVRVDEIEDLFSCSSTLAMQPVPKGPNLVILGNAGGPNVMATDALMSRDGRLAELSQQSLEALNNLLPPFWSKSNPVDILGDASADRYRKALEICLADQNVDGVAVIYTPQGASDPADAAQAVIDACANTGKPVLTSWMGEEDVTEARRLLSKNNIPTFATPEQAIKTHLYMYSARATLFSTQVMSLFDPNPGFLASGPPALRMFAFGFFTVGLQQNLSAFFQATGKVIPSLVVASSRQIIFLIPCLLIMPSVFGLTGLWAAFPVADALSLVLTLVWTGFAFRNLEIPFRLRPI